ncbi:hypothetical protein AMECASPLE_003891 [Ameca splendens]|uniref:Uncharacterized protein n=1 Tax=Ameca splendens TaxID=208324 RepID=A0ABV0Z7H9_9TELE
MHEHANSMQKNTTAGFEPRIFSLQVYSTNIYSLGLKIATKITGFLTTKLCFCVIERCKRPENPLMHTHLSLLSWTITPRQTVLELFLWAGLYAAI